MIHSLLIVKDQQLVFEAYWPGADLHPMTGVLVEKVFDRETLHYVASVSKSITSALVGSAVDSGWIRAGIGPGLYLRRVLRNQANRPQRYHRGLHLPGADAGVSNAGPQNLYNSLPMASLTLDWLHIIVLLGAIQGVFLAGALATKRRNRTANRLLAATMLAFSIGLASTVYHAGYVEVLPHFFGWSYPLPFLYGPLVYLYARCAADRNRRLTRLDALHLVPFLATVTAGLPIYLMSGAEKVAFFYLLQSGGPPPLLIQIADPLKFVSGITYTALTISFLRRHRERVKESYSSTERVNLRWLLWLGAAGAAIWTLAVGFEVMESIGIARVARSDDFISLAVAFLVYGIGYRGMRQPEIFRYETAEFPVVLPETPTPTATATEPETAGPRYERSGLTSREAERLKDRLTAMMEKERPWQDSGLTLADLAARLSTTPHKLSEVLNSQLGQTFYDFVNGYRVREVQRRIAAGEAQRVKMLTLALDAGFASKSTFNLVFKKHTSQTPSRFRQAAGS